MKKLIIFLFLTGMVLAQSIEQPKHVTSKSIKKVDSNTLEVTITTTTVEKVVYDKAVLQTELDHIPERIAELQKQIDVINERKAELEELIKAMK